MAEYEAALRIRPDPVVRQMVDRLRAERQPATPFRALPLSDAIRSPERPGDMRMEK
jgi:hypothetical protein